MTSPNNQKNKGIDKTLIEKEEESSSSDFLPFDSLFEVSSDSKYPDNTLQGLREKLDQNSTSKKKKRKKNEIVISAKDSLRTGPFAKQESFPEKDPSLRSNANEKVNVNKVNEQLKPITTMNTQNVENKPQIQKPIQKRILEQSPDGNYSHVKRALNVEKETKRPIKATSSIKTPTTPTKDDNYNKSESLLVADLDNTPIEYYRSLIADKTIHACITIITSLSFRKEDLDTLISHLISLKNTRVFICFIISASKARHRDILYLIFQTQMNILLLNTITFEDQRLIFDIDKELTYKTPLVLIDKEVTGYMTALTKKENCFSINDLKQLNLTICPNMDLPFYNKTYDRYFMKDEYESYRKAIGSLNSSDEVFGWDIDEYPIQELKSDLEIYENKPYLEKNQKLILEVKLFIFGKWKNDIKTSWTMKNNYEALLRIAVLNQIGSKMIQSRLQLSFDLSLFFPYDYFNGRCRFNFRNDDFIIFSYEFSRIR